MKREPDYLIHITMNREDVRTPFAEWEAWWVDDEGTTHWFGGGTAPTPGACIDIAERCLISYAGLAN